ncbi:chondroitin proteoglycan 2-like [Haliotis asinina]|uniref:chondroitin proteoglycan 2-like n=1 Tax=Haliotis asinina TaxID=109174 RepID=UPI003531CBF7
MDTLLWMVVACATVLTSLGQSTSWVQLCDGRRGSFPHPDYCNQYIVCANTRIYVMNCPVTLHFNAARGYCDYPRNARCRISRPSKCPDLMVCPDHVMYFEFPDWSNCSSFYVCTEGQLAKRSCPAGLFYDFINWTCTYEDEATCFQASN